MTAAHNTILVTGAAGLAGSSLVEHILAEHPDLLVVGTYRGTRPWIEDPRVTYLQADLTDPASCARAAASCDAAVMLAAHSAGSGMPPAEQAGHATDNIVLDARMLEALCRAGVGRIVYVSSATVYQDHDGLMTEDLLDLNTPPQNAHLGTGCAKRCAEQLCALWHSRSGARIMIARASNIYGPYARFDPAWSNFIPAIVRKAADGMDPFEVWGSPDVARDVIFGKDFARAVMRLLAYEGSSFDVVNVGTGKPVTVGEVVGLALKHAGHAPGQIAYRPFGNAAPASRVLDCTKMKTLTGWEASVGPDEGIAATMAWWRTNREAWTR